MRMEDGYWQSYLNKKSDEESDPYFTSMLKKGKIELNQLKTQGGLFYGRPGNESIFAI